MVATVIATGLVAVAWTTLPFVAEAGRDSIFKLRTDLTELSKETHTNTQVGVVITEVEFGTTVGNEFCDPGFAEITIYGRNLGDDTTKVFLGDYPELVLCSASAENIVALLPVDVEYGDYLLQVVTAPPLRQSGRTGL